MFNKYKLLYFIRGKNPQKIAYALFIAASLIFFTHPGRFAKRYSHIPDDAIPGYLVPYKKLEYDSCAPLPNLSSEVRNVGYVAPYNSTQWAISHNVNLGGWWTPDSCEAAHQVALVIPYRDRPRQLDSFLYYMHEFLQSQLLNYRIIIVEQAYGKAFNRGKLMNVGFKEAQKLQSFPCFVFHDIDLIPQVEKNIYACTKYPRHMSSSINVWRYNLLYHGAFGGAIAITTDQFQLVNGFSNSYFGWGAEDDDLLMSMQESMVIVKKGDFEFLVYCGPRTTKCPSYCLLPKLLGRFGSDLLDVFYGIILEGEITKSPFS